MVLRLKKMGMNFGSEFNSDVKNHRVRTIGECINGKDGRVYFLEFCLWENRKKARTTTKRGKPLRHVKYDIINKEGMYLDTEFTDDKGSWCNLKIEKEINDMNFSYTTEDILNVVNLISVDKYSSVEFIN